MNRPFNRPLAADAAAFTVESGSHKPLWIPTAEQCPRCHGNDSLEPVDVDDYIYHVCRTCNYSAGVDDSTDDEALAALLVVACLDESKNVNLSNDGVKVRIATCEECGNEDVFKQRIIELDQEQSVAFIECLVCNAQLVVTISAENVDENGASWDSDSGYNMNMDDVDSWNTSNDHSLSDVDSHYYNNDEAEFGDYVQSDPDDDRLNHFDYWLVDDEECERNQTSSATSAATDVVDDLLDTKSLLVCSQCHNNNINLFKTEYNPLNGKLVTVQCFACDCVIVNSDSSSAYCQISYIECSHCGNKTEDCFAKFFDVSGVWLQSIKCLVCSKMSHFDDLPRSVHTETKHHSRRSQRRDIGVGRERILDLRQLQHGDHVAWHKWYAIWHHAIVLHTDSDRLQMTVIHNSGSSKLLDGKLASVRLETIDVDPKRDDLYRFVYDTTTTRSDGDTRPRCFSPETVVERAASKLRQTYNPFTFNCEHFAQWCKTGRKFSKQVRTTAS